MAALSVRLLVYASSLLALLVKESCPTYVINYRTPSDCGGTGPGRRSQFYDLSQLDCRECSENSSVQRQSSDGFACECQPGFKYLSNFGSGHVKCTACEINETTSEDGWSCIFCDSNNHLDKKTRQCVSCGDRKVTVERKVDGSLIYNQNNQTVRTCESCETDTILNEAGNRCVRCSQILSMIPNSNCSCPIKQQVGGLCFADAQDVVIGENYKYEIQMMNGKVVDSLLLRQHLGAAFGMCQMKYGNVTACQILGNLCVLMYYSGEDSQNFQACSLYKRLKDENGRKSLKNLNWPEGMPWLYYLNERPINVLKDNGIPTHYTFNPPAYINFQAAKYSMLGKFLGFSNVTEGELQLCKESETKMNAAYLFGATYEKSVCVTLFLVALQFWDAQKYPLIFYELFLEFEENGEKKLYAIPVIIENYRTARDEKLNVGGNEKPTRRFFLVDNEATKQPSGLKGPNIKVANDYAAYARYVEVMTLVVSLRDEEKGKIYPPYFRIKYGEVSRKDAVTGKKVQITFKSKYSMVETGFLNDYEIAIGTLSAFGILYAGYNTWVWSKRAGRIAIDFLTIINFFFFLCGSLANVFFVTSYGIALYFLVFFKKQNAIYVLHLVQENTNKIFPALLASAFTLKLMHMLQLLIAQCTIDIFFLDWERPRGVLSVMAAGDGRKGKETPVSIWRTYFVANEWNELQIVRKINRDMQIFIVVFFLMVVGLEDLATMDPDGRIGKTDDEYQAPHSIIFRYAVAATVYLVVGLVQWMFFTFIYEWFIEHKVKEFVDLCSMSNISVFIMSHSNFGYYIHGRSVHGRADTDMWEMHDMMKKEEEDLCSHRGLMPNTEKQTFQMSLPRKLRVKYDQILFPIILQQNIQPTNKMEPGRAGGSQSRSRITGTAIERSIQAYETLNKFLSSFIDHSLRDIDYFVKDKTLLENITDAEFFDTSERGLFYNDDGHSFDQVMFYGHECTLFLFELLSFCFVDLIGKNFVLAGVLTYLLSRLITEIRMSAGKKNLARKTLVDQRFLI